MPRDTVAIPVSPTSYQDILLVIRGPVACSPASYQDILLVLRGAVTILALLHPIRTSSCSGQLGN